MIARLVAAACAAVLMTTAPAQAAQAPSPPAVGSPSERADALLRTYTAETPGIAVIVARGGQVVFERYLGGADLEHGQAVTATTRFHVASVSKQFTAFAVAKLASEGKIDLQADIRTYLPDMPDYGRKVRVIDLLQHTSGIRDQWGLFVLSGYDFSDLLRQRAIMSYARRETELNFAPGTQYEYCNTGYSLAAAIVEKVSGMSLRKYLDAQVFAPLGMSGTLVYDDASELVPGRAMSYSTAPDGKARLVRLNYSNYGATSLHSTPRDLLRWSQEQLHPSVIDPAVLKAMRTPGKLADGTPITYGLGIDTLDIAGRKAFGHGGSDAGFRAYIASFPAEDASIVIMSNGAADVFDLTWKLTDIFLNGGEGGFRRAAAEAPDAQALGRFPGWYTNDRAPAFELAVRDGQLVRVGAGADGMARFTKGGGFFFGRSTAEYRLAPNGRDLVVTGGPGGPQAFRRLERATPTPEALAALAGDYRSEELDTTYRLAVRNGLLEMSSLRTPPVFLTPLDADRFESPLYYGAVVRVVRDAKGQPSALRIGLMGGRVRDVLFERR
jgi:CubicO group peptidase (beta-lactamase class C family)